MDGFAVFGGRPTDQRLARTGRIDVVLPPVDENTDASAIGRGWELVGPVS